MILSNIYQAIFLERLNRFVGKGILNNNEILFHIGDTGRLKELLIKGNQILIQKLVNDNKRKYKYRLIGIKNLKNERILLNSLLHSKIVEEYLKKRKIDYIKEIKVGNSRIDFLINNDTFVEIKGCSLAKGNIGLFPDAPTIRGTKHLKDLLDLLKKGKKAEIWFLMMNKVKYFSTNKQTDILFSKTFKKFIENGGKIRFFDVNFNYKDNKINIGLKENKNIEILD